MKRLPILALALMLGGGSCRAQSLALLLVKSGVAPLCPSGLFSALPASCSYAGTTLSGFRWNVTSFPAGNGPNVPASSVYVFFQQPPANPPVVSFSLVSMKDAWSVNGKQNWYGQAFFQTVLTVGKIGIGTTSANPTGNGSVHGALTLQPAFSANFVNPWVSFTCGAKIPATACPYLNPGTVLTAVTAGTYNATLMIGLSAGGGYANTTSWEISLQ